jgi:signal transduction histidine kinase
MTPTRILLVEDERIMALYLRQQLGEMGYTVVAAVTSGEEALRQIEAQQPDIILMDIQIDGPIDGIETTSRIPPDRQIPVIYLTAFAEEATLERASATKPYGYLVKPFSTRELHATIQMALARCAADVALRNNEQRLEQLVKARTAELERQTEERLKAEQTLRQAQKLEAIGRLTSGVAHHFNNLLTVVVGNLTLLERRLTDESLANLANAALEAALRGAKITRQLLSFGRRQMVRPVNLDINEILLGQDRIIRRGVGPLSQVDYRLRDLHALCCIDREEFERAILNLVLNAQYAMPGGGTLTIETDIVQVETRAADANLSAGNYMRITLRDTGHGMTPDVLTHAFDPFFTTKDVGKGSGLGLSQVYGFAKQSGGHAMIESTVGNGTSVVLYLPLATATGEAEHPALMRV